MGKRRADADGRRFFDEFESVKAGRLRAMGIIDPAKDHALIPFGDKTKLLAVAHTRFWNGGGWSFFRCPGCNRRASKLWLIDSDLARCIKCCNAMNIRYRSEYGFGRNDRRKAADKALDELIAKLATTTPLRFKPNTWNWGGKAKLVYNNRRLTQLMRRSMISLRLKQLAYQDAKDRADPKDRLKTHQPLAEAKSMIDIRPIWRAKSREDLEQALDKAQIQIIAALKSDDPQIRLSAVRLMLRTKQARERGVSA